MAEKEKKEQKGRQLTRWDPFADLDLLEGWNPFRDWPFAARGPAAERPALPAVDVHESDDAYVVTAELPGIDKKDVHVELDEGVLTLRGEKRSEREEKKERTRWTERSYGSFTRSFRLPRDADPDRIDASFKDGVLTVQVARTGEKKPRVVSVKS